MSAKDLNDLAREQGNGFIPPKGVAWSPPVRSTGKRTANVVNLASVEPEPVRWLWPGFIPLGKLVLIAGNPGVGKGFLTVDIASRVSTGRGWPFGTDDELGVPGSVLFLSGEDAAKDTIVPRLISAGADRARVGTIASVTDERGKEAFPDLSRDIGTIADALRTQHRPRLIVIDPISSFLGDVDAYKNAKVRGILTPLMRLAEEHSVTVLLVSHLNKNQGASAAYRITDSIGIPAACRSVFAVVEDRDDKARRILPPVKQNLAKDTLSGRYEVREEGADGGPCVVWEPESFEGRASDLLGPEAEDGPRLREAIDFLRDELADGPVAVAEIKSAAKSEGISTATLRRARESLGVVKKKESFQGGWTWALPDDNAVADDGAST